MDITLNRLVMPVHERTQVTPEQAGGQAVMSPATDAATARQLPAGPAPEPAEHTEGVVASAADDGKELEEAVDSMQNSVLQMQRNLSFTIDENSGRTVVEVRDVSSGEVIRQLPSEQALKLAESLDEMRSLLFEAQA